MSALSRKLDSTDHVVTPYGGSRNDPGPARPRSLNDYLDELERGSRREIAGSYAFGSFSGSQHAPPGAPSATDEDIGYRPFVHFVAKVVSRCNIRCTYCYVYESADQTWRSMPMHMSKETELAMMDRVVEYLAAREAPEALVIMHGGEPLLYGPERIDRLAERIGLARAQGGTDVRLAIQTNATLVDDANLQVLVRHQVQVGVSLDGPPEMHDLARRTMQGGGTYDMAAAGLRRLLAATSEGLPPPAVTAVIDPGTRPRDLIEHFLDLGVEYIDFQLPNLNHDSYPHERWPPGTFGAWLIELYDELWQAERLLRVRSVELLIRLLSGAIYGGDILGQRSYGTLVIDTDGTYHAHDALKATFNGATETGFSVRNDKISSVENHPMVLAFTNKASLAAETCQTCPLFKVCGGGLPAHRYSGDRGFDNPSVYCADLAMFIRHVDGSIRRWRRAD